MRNKLSKKKSKQIEDIEHKMKNLVLFRGTIKDIESKLNSIGIRDDYILEPFEDSIYGNDFGFNINLGMAGDHYLDFEVYMLDTNKKNVSIITEVNPF